MKFLVFVTCLAGIVSAVPMNEPAAAGEVSLVTRTTKDKPTLVKVCATAFLFSSSFPLSSFPWKEIQYRLVY